MKNTVNSFSLEHLSKWGIKEEAQFLCISADNETQEVLVHIQSNNHSYGVPKIKVPVFHTCWSGETLDFNLDECTYVGSVKMLNTESGKEEMRHLYVESVEEDVVDFFKACNKNK